jgi:hypothetical protein
MKLTEQSKLGESATVQARMRAGLEESIFVDRAHLRLVHRTPKNWKLNKNTGLMEPDVRLIPHKIVGPSVMVPDPDCYDVLFEDEAYNVKTNVGIVFTHTQTYGTTGLGSNGLNYIALSNDTLTETSTSTTLSSEIVSNGLTRVQGTVVLPTGSGTQTTVDKTFTATGTQAAQKAALFTAVSAGTMNHALAFTQRTLASGDTLDVTFTLTIS